MSNKLAEPYTLQIKTLDGLIALLFAINSVDVEMLVTDYGISVSKSEKLNSVLDDIFDYINDNYGKEIERFRDEHCTYPEPTETVH
jgi:hypothetical protein